MSDTPNNMRIWEKLSKTDPTHTKKFQRAGGFRGTAIKPIYQLEKMTEAVGPAGIEWGTTKPKFTIVPGNDGQVAVYCSVGLLLKEGLKDVGMPIYGVGGDMVVVKDKNGLRTDDEAFKKAYTDALGNAMKHLGMSADVHMGLFDDSKYVQEREREERAIGASYTPAPNTTPNMATDALDEALGASVGQGTLSRWAARPIDGEYRKELEACPSVEAINAFWANPKFQAEFVTFPKSYQDMLTSYRDELIEGMTSSATWAEDIDGKLRACLSIESLKAAWEEAQPRIGRMLYADVQTVEATKEEMKKVLLKVGKINFDKLDNRAPL